MSFLARIIVMRGIPSYTGWHSPIMLEHLLESLEKGIKERAASF